MKSAKQGLLMCIAGLVMALAAGSAAQAVLITFESYPGPDGILGTGDDIPISAPALFSGQPVQLTTQFDSVGLTFLPNPSLQDMNEILNDSTWTRTVGTSPTLLSTSRSSSMRLTA